MKKYFLCVFIVALMVSACNSKNENGGGTAGSDSSTIDLPYKMAYATTFNNNVSDSDLLLALNSYKYWENGDMKALRSTMGDSMYVNGAEGFKFAGRTDSLMNTWLKARDSLSSVSIIMEVWLKNHSVKDSMNYINVWYKEIDTYKSGKVDSANYEDDNAIRDGKIVWFSSHRQKL